MSKITFKEVKKRRVSSSKIEGNKNSSDVCYFLLFLEQFYYADNCVLTSLKIGSVKFIRSFLTQHCHI